MSAIRTFALAFLVVLLLRPTAWAKPAAPAADKAASSGVSEPIHPRYQAGDDAFKLRADGTRAREALKLYRSYYADSPDDPEAAWRVAMGCYFIGIRLTEDSDTKEKLYAEGRDAGLKGAKLDPSCTPCHFWGAINMALYGETVGVFKMVFTLNEVREHLKKVIQLQPTYANAGAYRLEGLIEQKLPGILGGSDDRAKLNFERAIANAPHEPLNFLFMARLLEEKFDDAKQALQFAKLGLAVPPPGPDRLESRDALKDLEALIAKLESKKDRK